MLRRRLAQKDGVTQKDKQQKKTKTRFPPKQDAVEMDADSKRGGVRPPSIASRATCHHSM